MEKFAVLGVDSVGIAHSQRAAATNRDTSNVGPGRLACWDLGSHHVAGLEASPSLVSKLKQAENLRRLVAILVGDDGNAGGLAAAVELHSERLNITPDAVLQADGEPVAPAAFDKQPLLAARHDRPLALIEDEYRQFRLLNLALTGPLPCGQSPLGNVADRRLSKTRFVPIPGLSAAFAFERPELKEAFARPTCLQRSLGP
jgi:hypothetical protein